MQLGRTHPIRERPRQMNLPHNLALLWDSVAELTGGSLITEPEASAYIAGTLPADKLAQIDRLLDETPEFAAELRHARDEFAAYFTPEMRAKTEQEFRRPARWPRTPETYPIPRPTQSRDRK